MLCLLCGCLNVSNWNLAKRRCCPFLLVSHSPEMSEIRFPHPFVQQDLIKVLLTLHMGSTIYGRGRIIQLCISSTAVPGGLEMPADTGKLKRHLSLLFDRLLKGGHLNTTGEVATWSSHDKRGPVSLPPINDVTNDDVIQEEDWLAVLWSCVISYCLVNWTVILFG